MISLAAALLAGGALAAKSTMDSKQVDLFKANVEALTRGEGTIVTQSICAYATYSWCIYFNPYEEYEGTFVSDTWIRPL